MSFPYDRPLRVLIAEGKGERMNTADASYRRLGSARNNLRTLDGDPNVRACGYDLRVEVLINKAWPSGITSKLRLPTGPLMFGVPR